MSWLNQFEQYIQETSHFWTGKTMERYSIVPNYERQVYLRKKQSLKEREAEIVHAKINARITSVQSFRNQSKVKYLCHLKFLIKQDEFFYIEENLQNREAVFEKEELISDAEIFPDVLLDKNSNKEQMNKGFEAKDLGEATHKERGGGFHYDRLKAVKYADNWWNRYNPQYKKFDVDCTNYISQCLHAGGAPMHGQPNRSSGWWFGSNNWSYSWSVANAMRWYLSGSKQGLRARTVDQAEQLVPGDVICYDWEGNGEWNHNVIVTDKDANGMPLVNAHTYNSRHRYWEYKDSPAWTEHTQYKFFKILDDKSK